ncbi:MAG: acetyltransferase [Planctomycetota bacterium]|nr:acetyltransferase [Planctomycetota bacterium]
MTIFRAFLNSDPPALVDLWNRALPERAVVRPLTPHEFDALVIGRIGFDRHGLILAEDTDSGRILGFVHAGFGPKQPCGPSHRLDTAMGTVAMFVTEPGRDDSDLEMGLFLEAERYLRRGGAEVFYAGGQPPLDPFYRGLYGGSEFAGILDSHAAFTRAALRAGYQPAARTLLLEADLSRAEPRDPKAPLLRRQVRMDFAEDARTPGWWDALAIGLFRPTRFELIEKTLNRPIARAWTWDIAGGFGVGDGRSRAGLIDLEVDPAFRRKGFGRHLVAEILRHVRHQNTDVLTAQTSVENTAALALYHSLGFEPVESSTLYRLPAEVAERSRIERSA